MTGIILIGIAVLVVFLYIYTIGKMEENEERYDQEFIEKKEDREE